MKPVQLFAHWEQVRKDTILTIEKFSNEELAYTPFEDSWSVGTIALHIADCEYYWLHYLAMKDTHPPFSFKLADYPVKQSIIEVLNQVHEKTLSFLNGLDEKDLETLFTTSRQDTFTLYWMIWHVVEHEIHHRGELSLIHGLLGRQGLDV